MPLDADVDRAQQIHLVHCHGAHRDQRVQKAGGPDDLLRHLRAVLTLVVAGRSRNKDHLVKLGFHFLKLERSVIKS